MSLAVISPGISTRRQRHCTLSNLIGACHGARVVTRTSNGHGNLTGHIGEVIRAVGNGVVRILNQRGLAIFASNRGLPLMSITVVLIILRRINIGARLNRLSSYLQLTKLFGECVVLLINRTPRNFIRIVRLTNFGLRTSGLNRSYTSILTNKSLERSLVLGERRTIKDLLSAASCNCKRSRRNGQLAAHRNVVVISGVGCTVSLNNAPGIAASNSSIFSNISAKYLCVFKRQGLAIKNALGLIGCNSQLLLIATIYISVLSAYSNSKGLYFQ